MTRKKTTRLTALLLLLLVVGCGTEGRYSEDDIEYQLASIDAGKKLGLSDPATDAYASALDDLETRCGDDRRFLGDMATKAVEILERDAGVSYSTFEVLEGLYLAVGPDEFLESCSDRLAAWLTLVVEGS